MMRKGDGVSGLTDASDESRGKGREGKRENIHRSSTRCYRDSTRL